MSVLANRRRQSVRLQARWLRRFYLVVLLYLVSLLLVWIVPNSFVRVTLPSEVVFLAHYGRPFCFS